MNRRARLGDVIALTAIRALASLVVLLIAGIVAGIVAAGWGELTRLGFWTNPPNLAGAGGGIFPQLFNTGYVLVLSLIFTLPVGVMAGIWFAEYAREGRTVAMARRATETLASVPSIVVGLFGYALFVNAVHAHPTRLAAALAITVINLPYAVRITENSLRDVPVALREASGALGATQWQTIRRALVPAALPGLITGVILLVGRAVGEAAAVLFTGSGGAVTSTSAVTWSPFASGDTLAVNLYIFRIQADPSTVPDATAYSDGVAALLLLLVVAITVTARVAGRMAVNRLQGTR